MVWEKDGYEGLFIVFEGVDGSGKGEQSRRLQRHIQDLSKYVDVLATHEPWKSNEIKRKLEQDRSSYSDGERMAELYVEDRVIHTKRLIRPMLNAGGIVLADRYKMSTCAYQWTQGIDLHKLIDLHQDRGLITPDLTILLDVEAEDAKVRRDVRGSKGEKFEKEEQFVKKLVEAYRSLGHMAQVDEKIFGRVVMIDASPSPEEVAKRVAEIFDPLYQKRFSPE